LKWNAYPASLTSYIEAEKSNIGLDLSYLLNEEGGYVLQENGDRILL
jgi:hypothetical protein